MGLQVPERQSVAGQTRHTGSSHEAEEVVIVFEFLADNNIRKKEQTEKYQGLSNWKQCETKSKVVLVVNNRGIRSCKL